MFHVSCLLVAAAAAGLPQEAIPACRQMRQQLLARVSELPLPANFLDVLIDELGGPGAVAEMTGRKGRVVKQVCAHQENACGVVALQSAGRGCFRVAGRCVVVAVGVPRRSGEQGLWQR